MIASLTTFLTFSQHDVQYFWGRRIIFTVFKVFVVQIIYKFACFCVRCTCQGQVRIRYSTSWPLIYNGGTLNAKPCA